MNGVDEALLLFNYPPPRSWQPHMNMKINIIINKNKKPPERVVHELKDPDLPRRCEIETA